MEENCTARKCFLCGSRRTAYPRRLHPYLHMQFFAICTTCDEHLRNAAHLRPYLVNVRNGAGTAAKNAGVRDEGDTEVDVVSDKLENYRQQHIARLVYLCELLIWRSKLPEMSKLRQSLRNERKEGAYSTPSNLGVDRGIIVCAATLLADVGVRIQDGCITFPLDTISLPCGDEARTAVELSFATSGCHLDVDEVWDKSFPAYPWESTNSPHTIFECLFSLFGLVVEPEKRASRRRLLSPTLTLHRKEVESLLSDANQNCPPFFASVIQPLGAAPVVAEEVTHAAFFAKGLPLPKTTVDFCACCLKISSKDDYPFRMLDCDSCERKLCTVCLGRVIGTHEIVRSVRLKSYTCPCCRLQAKVNAPDESTRPEEKFKRAKSEKMRKRKHQELVTVGKEVPPEKKKKKPVFLCMSRNLAYSIQNLPSGKSHERCEQDEYRAKMTLREQVGFAKLCEDINFANLKEARAGKEEKSVLKEGRIRAMDVTVCMKCKLPLGAKAEYEGKLDYNWVVYESADGSGNGLKICECGVVLHAACFGAEGDCGRHKCAKCGSDPKVKCLTCTKAYCLKCTPPRRKVHLFNEEWMACEDCREGLEVPRSVLEVDPKISNVNVGSSLSDFKVSATRDRVLATSFVNDIVNIHATIDTRNTESVRKAVLELEKNYNRKIYKYHFERPRAKERRGDRAKA